MTRIPIEIRMRTSGARAANRRYGVRRRGAAALHEQTGGVNTSPINSPWLVFTSPVCFMLIGRFAAGAGRLGAESAYIRVIRGSAKTPAH